MKRLGDALAIAAAELIGIPFRLQGSNPEFGVDCVGLVTCSLERIGRVPVRPHGYRLRNTSIDHHLALAEANGFEPVEGPCRPGDVILVKTGPGQHHVMIAENPQQFIHAHAGLQSVVRMPGPVEWPIMKHWRLRAGN